MKSPIGRTSLRFTNDEPLKIESGNHETATQLRWQGRVTTETDVDQPYYAETGDWFILRRADIKQK